MGNDVNHHIEVHDEGGHERELPSADARELYVEKNDSNDYGGLRPSLNHAPERAEQTLQDTEGTNTETAVQQTLQLVAERDPDEVYPWKIPEATKAIGRAGLAKARAAMNKDPM